MKKLSAKLLIYFSHTHDRGRRLSFLSRHKTASSWCLENAYLKTWDRRQKQKQFFRACLPRIDGLTLEGALWVIRARFQGNKAAYFRSDFKFGNETYTVCGVTSFQGLPAFLSRSSEYCGRTNFFYG